MLKSVLPLSVDIDITVPVLHFPGTKRFRVKEPLKSNTRLLWAMLLRTVKPFQMNRTTLITWNNSARKGILEYSLNVLGVPHIVLGKHLSRSNWRNREKIAMTLKALKDVDTEYVMGIDSHDALIRSNPEERLDVLNDGYDLVFNASERNVIVYDEADKLSEAMFPSRFCYLNAGAWVGRTKFCREFFHQATQHEEHLGHWVESLNLDLKETQYYMDSEQIRLKKAFVELAPRVGLDSKQRMFQLVTLNYLK